jgi:hypothetical protein
MVCIILLNYKNPQDTIICLESILNLGYPQLKIMLCDNGSEDDSIHQFTEWAEKVLLQEKKLGYSFVRDNPAGAMIEKNFDENRTLYILENKVNHGYAGGVNLGIKYALKMGLFKYIWILNNDTILDQYALFYLVDKMEKNPMIGLCGSTILYAHDRRKVQALGGFLFNRVFGFSKQIGNGKMWSKELTQLYTEDRIEREMFGVQGASLFVRKEFLEKVGLMNEEYFLYCEEQEWAIRSRGGFKLGYASKSLVYHQEGKTTGSNSYQTKKSFKADFYLTRNRILYTKKYTPLFLPTVIATHFLIAGKRLLTKQPLNALLIVICLFLFSKKTKSFYKEENFNYLSPFEHFIRNKTFNFLFGNKN